MVDISPLGEEAVAISLLPKAKIPRTIANLIRTMGYALHAALHIVSSYADVADWATLEAKIVTSQTQ